MSRRSETVPRSDQWPDFAAAAWFVAAVTALRVAVLAATPLDLWADEAQYWAWGQRLDWGYFSKPPLIGWTIAAFTAALGDTPFAIRLPGPLFHAATALILGLVAQERFGGRAGLWTAIGYVTLPMTALGGLLISTDTILAPFFAAALLFWGRLAAGGQIRDGVLAGLCIGGAVMAKYAGLYFWPGVALAALLAPSWRVRPAGALAALASFAVVIAPNVAWNVAHDLTTIEHTMDNTGWLRGGLTLNVAGAAEFLATQLAVFGPVLFVTLVVLPFLRPGSDRGGLLAMALPIVAFVTMQALMSGAYGNWAVTAYFAGSVAVLPWLALRARRLYWLSVAINGALCLAVALLALAPAWPQQPSGTPYLQRYLGRAAVPRQALDLAEAQGAEAIVADERGFLANLWYEGRDGRIALYASPHHGAPDHYYQQTFAWTDNAAEIVLYVTGAATALCPTDRVTRLNTSGTAWSGHPLYAHRLPPECHRVFE
jgi:4-amino-4-deoxy-L-arabinose transferase-like glycosyltransferase